MKRQTGSSLFEVLIAMVILSIGIFGLAALQATGIRGGMSAHHRSQAVLIANDMMDRLRANRNLALAGNYNMALNDEPPVADGVPPLTDDDIADWFNTRLGLLPAGDGAINCTAAAICSVVIQWNDGRIDRDNPTQVYLFQSQL